jgi:hypothetical protein
MAKATTREPNPLDRATDHFDGYEDADLGRAHAKIVHDINDYPGEWDSLAKPDEDIAP